MQTSAFQPTLADRMAIRHFRKALPKPRRGDFARALAAILEEEAERAHDRVTMGHMTFAGCILCSAHQWQAEGLTRQEARDQIRTTVLAFGRRSSAIAMWLTGVLAKDPFEAIRKHSIAKSKSGYGPTFDITIEQAEDAFAIAVNACGYRAFLARHGGQDLLPLFCEWDRVWIDAMPRGIAFARPTTLALGASACRFEFRREAAARKPTPKQRE